MKNYISVNAKYSKGSSISQISDHNDRTTDIDYLLNDEDIKYKNIDIVHNSDDGSGGSANLDESDLGGIGTYSDNLQKMRSAKPSSSNRINLKQAFHKLQKQKTKVLRKKYDYKPNEKENEIIEMVVGLSEDQALNYLNDGVDISKGYNEFMKQIKSKYGFEPLGVSIHFDEGYKDKNGNVHYNIHAHCTFYNFDFNKNKTVLRNLRKKDWENMQDVAQDSFQKHDLNFVRGETKGITKKEHLERNDYIIEQQSQELSNILNTLDSKEKELKGLYTTLNTQKNTLKDIRQQVDKNSNIYKLLSTNIKTLQVQEKATRLEHKNLKNDLQDKKDQLEIIDENIENQDTWIKETKQGLKDFVNEHTTKASNKYTINNINKFYNELVDLSIYLSKFDIKIDELEKLKTTNVILKDKLEKVERSDNYHSQNIKDLENKINSLVNTKNDLQDENYLYKKFLEDKNLDDAYNRFLKEEQKEHNIDIVEM